MKDEGFVDMKVNLLIETVKLTSVTTFLCFMKVHVQTFHMNQLACPTDFSSGIGGCAKMHLKIGNCGLLSKMDRTKGVK